MPLSLAQAHVLIAAAHDHAVANGWKIAVAVVDEGGLLVALGRMDGAFPLSAQIAEAKAAGTALWHRDGEQLAASRASHEGFFDAVSRLVRLPLIPGPGSVLIGAARACWAQPGRVARAATTTAPVSRQACGPSFRADTTGARDLGNGAATWLRVRERSFVLRPNAG